MLSRQRPSTITQYAFVVLAITLATLVRFAFLPVLNLEVPFILYFPTIVLCVWFGGLGPGLLSTALGALLALYFFFTPQYTLRATDPTAPAQLIIFSLAGALISALAESLHRSKRRTDESETKEREQRERLRVTLASIGEAVIATDALGRVTFMNPVAEALTGWEQEEVTGAHLNHVFKIVNEFTREAVENPALRATREGTTPTLAKDTVLISRNGDEIPIGNSGAPIKDTEGRTLGAVLIFRDMREFRQAEKERERLADIVASSEDAIVSKNLDGLIQSWNAAAERMFGYSASEAIGRPITIIVPPERLEEERRILMRLRNGERIEHFETIRVSKNGTARDISLTVSPIRNAQGRIVGASKIARDVSERKRAEKERGLLLANERHAREEAEAANRSKDEFVAIVSHEIRTPLNAILGWVQLLRTGKFDQTETDRALEIIERSARTQAQIIEDLLDISRAITGKLTLRARSMEPAEVIEGALESIRPAVNAKAIQLQVHLAPECGIVWGDPARLQQVVWNLLSNAVKFTPAHGLIELRMERTDSHVQIMVNDSGVGIRPEFLPFVFDRFAQADGGSQRRYGGLGLGLAIVRHLVELHGGTVRAESPGEGKGAKFIVALPIRSVRQDLQELERRTSTDGRSSFFLDKISLTGVRVMIVDDQAETRELLSAILMQRGAEVMAYASAAEALEAVERRRPSILISDIGMPIEDGYTLIQKVRALGTERGGDIPAVALTGFAGNQDRARTLAAGFQTHLPKPVEPVELIMVIASLTGVLR